MVDQMHNMRLLGSASWLFAGLMSVASGVYAQNIITALSVGYNSSSTVIKVDLARPLSRYPDTEFIISPSPHIVLEFPDTANGLSEPVQEFAEGGLRSANIVQSGERTRLMLYLNEMSLYNIRIDGNSLLIALQGNTENAGSITLRPADTKQDAQRKMLISEANARLKAKQEAQAAEEEKAKQAAEAKAEAERVKAEQKAKIEAAAQARKTAKAEAAKLLAEQKAKLKAEQQAAAQARKAAKAEAAKLVAEQKAKVKAEQQAAEKARKAAEAEAAKLAAEQKAKVKAEQQAAEKARQAAEAEVARLRVKWEMVGENKTLALTTYADPNIETIPNNANKTKKNGYKVKMWRMYDYKAAQESGGYKFMSSKFLDEYDCKEEQKRLLVNTTFSGNMGAGEVIFTIAEAGKWQTAMPNSIDEVMWKFACKNK